MSKFPFCKDFIRNAGTFERSGENNGHSSGKKSLTVGMLEVVCSIISLEVVHSSSCNLPLSLHTIGCSVVQFILCLLFIWDWVTEVPAPLSNPFCSIPRGSQVKRDIQTLNQILVLPSMFLPIGHVRTTPKWRQFRCTPIKTEAGLFSKFNHDTYSGSLRQTRVVPVRVCLSLAPSNHYLWTRH